MFTDHFIPMGAVAGDLTHKILTEPDVWLEHKWNGHRATCWIYDDGSVHFFSAVEAKKDGKPTGFLSENTDALPHLVKEIEAANFPRCTIFDGEIVTSLTEPSDSHKVTSLLKPKKGKAVERQGEQGNLYFVVFDLIDYGGESLTNHDNLTRVLQLDLAFSKFLKNPTFVHQTERYKDNFDELIAEWTARGFEGAIAKRPSAKIKVKPMGSTGKSRSSDWVKIKVQRAEYDVVPMGVTWPEPMTLKKGDKEKTPNKFYERGQIGGIVFGQYVPDELADPKAVTKVVAGYDRLEESRAQVAASMAKFKLPGYTLQPYGVFGNMTDELREYLTHNADEWIGKVVVTVQAWTRYADTGFFQHPSMVGGEPRIDKTPEQCTYTPGEIQV